MRHAALLLAVLVCCLSTSFHAHAVTPEKLTVSGREFWVCFQKNYRDFDRTTLKKSDSLTLQLVLSAEKNTTVTIHTSQGKEQTYHLEGGTPLWVAVDTSLQVQSSEVIQPMSMHIAANNPITVQGINQRFQTSDTFSALPVEYLGTEYRAIGYNKLSDDLLSQCAVIATENNTRVTITPSVKTQALKPRGVPFVVTLNKGDVYQVISAYEVGPNAMCDLTGTLIQSDKTIAVFSGHNCAYVPQVVAACNHLVEQLMPLKSWGLQYYVGMLAQRSTSTIRIVAHEPDTHVRINGEEVAVLGIGEYYTNNEQRENLWIVADKPVMVAQYGQGYKNGDSAGDPMMMMIRSVEIFQDEYHFTPPARGYWHHFINVVVREDELESLELDGKSVDPSLFKRCGDNGYMIGQIPVTGETAHSITCDEPFGISCYGIGYSTDAYDAYGNM